MESRRSRTGHLRGMCICAAVLLSTLAPAAVPSTASATSPVLEFVIPGHSSTKFTAEGGEVTAALNGFGTPVQCTGSEGEGEVTGPRSTISNYIFTGCAHGAQECHTSGADPGEIWSIEHLKADLVYVDQAKHEVDMLLNPDGGTYISFLCGAESVRGFGSFLSPVDPINQLATTFTATLSRSEATQVPSEYENANGEKVQAIPMGEREGKEAPQTTGVELGFEIHTDVPLEIKALNTAEVEAKRRAEEEAAAKKRQEEEAKKHQEEEAAKKRQEEEAARKRAQHRAKALKHCRKAKSKHKRVQCEKRVKRKYGAPSAPSKYSAPGRALLAVKL
jgi:hypothetical protein